VDLTWWLVVIAACVALAAGIAAVLLVPLPRTAARPLANVGRLTRLPAYVRAARRRTILVVATVTLLGIAGAATVVAAARPTGLPTSALDTATAQPEDVMVCTAGPPDDPTTAATMRYFAGQIPTFDTQRIGLTSAHRRVVPMTRDHQYAGVRFGEYADGRQPSPAVDYANYAGSVEDLLALCITGFPGFEHTGAQRRSLIYVGPGTLRAPDEDRPAVLDADRVRELARTAGVQVDAVLTTPENSTVGVLDALVAETGGRADPPGTDVTARLTAIRSHPPPPTSEAGPGVRAATPDTPDVPLVVAIVAVLMLALVPLVVRP
jgi:hypothetical protein